MSLSTEDKLPRLSYDLIDMLEKTYVHPEFPTTMAQWGHQDAAELRRQCFRAGQASVVRALMAVRDEELSDGEMPDSEEKPTDLLGTPLFEQGRVIRTEDAFERMGEADL